MNRKRKILFVDDEVMILRGYQRNIREYAQDWDVLYAASAVEALTLLSQYPIDAVVTDMHMPEMNGIELLDTTSLKYPGTIRIMLSGNTEDARILQSVHFSHYFFSKPCDMEELVQKIERFFQLQDRMSDPNLVNLITGTKKLPSLPSLYLSLLDALQSDDPDPKKIADIIAKDVAMTAKILQLVNSGFYSLPGKITSPMRAITILGINSVKALVLSIEIFSQYAHIPNPYFSLDNLWKHSLAVGQLARDIANALSFGKEKAEDLQVAGILHDIGKVIQLKIPGFFSKIKLIHGSITVSSEYQTYALSHAEIGAYLLGSWGLPQTIVEMVANHHRPGLISTPGINEITVLHVANGIHYLQNAVEPLPYSEVFDVDYLSRVHALQEVEGWMRLFVKQADLAK